MSILLEIISESLLLLLLVGTILSLLVGILFALSPQQGIALNRRLSHWTSLRRTTRPLEVLRHCEQLIYRHHRLFGLFAMGGAIYVLYQLGFNYDHQKVATTLAQTPTGSLVAEWLLGSFLWFTVPMMAIILLIGSLLAARPSYLKQLEQISNRWVSSRRWLQPLEQQHISLDYFIEHHPRGFGIAVTLLATYSNLLLIIYYMQIYH